MVCELLLNPEQVSESFVALYESFLRIPNDSLELCLFKISSTAVISTCLQRRMPNFGYDDVELLLAVTGGNTYTKCKAMLMVFAVVKSI